MKDTHIYCICVLVKFGLRTFTYKNLQASNVHIKNTHIHYICMLAICA